MTISEPLIHLQFYTLLLLFLYWNEPIAIGLDETKDTANKTITSDMFSTKHVINLKELTLP